MKHLSLLLLTCLSCTSLIYSMEKGKNKEHDLVGFSSNPSSRSLKLTKLSGTSQNQRANCTELDFVDERPDSINLERVLQMLPNLQTLKAVGCKITNIDQITTPNSTLTSLDLSGNQLQKWQMNLVAKATALKNLDLSNNKINEINLTEAQEELSLDLHNNEILYVELHQIRRGKPLAYLNLSGNNLSEQSYHKMLPYVPVDQGWDRTVSRIGNLIIAGAAGTVVTLLGLYYGYYQEQRDRNYYGTHGTEMRDEEETGGFTYGSILAGFGVAGGSYYKLNKMSDKIYALQHLQWVKKIDLSHQQSGIQLLRDEEDAKNK